MRSKNPANLSQLIVALSQILSRNRYVRAD
jgi:hypothetical protein